VSFSVAWKTGRVMEGESDDDNEDDESDGD